MASRPRCAVLTVLAWLSLAGTACGDSTTGLSRELVGTYVLESVDDGPIPNTVIWSGMFAYQFAAETLSVTNDELFALRTFVVDDGAPETFEMLGTVDVRGDSVFLLDPAFEVEVVTASGAAHAGGIELRVGSHSYFWQGRVLRYRKVDDPSA